MSRKQKPLFLFVMLLAALLTFTAVFAADNPASPAIDATLDYVPEKYAPTTEDLSDNGITAGDVAEVDVQAIGTNLQYTGLVLNGDGVNPNAVHPFLKVQQQNGTGNFEFGACYLGNNGSAGTFGLGFFTLFHPFKTGHMKAERVGNTVTIYITNAVNAAGNPVPDQTYTCADAPAPPGGKIGVHGYANTAKIDNFGNGAGGGMVLDTFSYTGPLGATGNWYDAAPGMNADGSQASGGPLALSFWVGQEECPPKFIDLSINEQGKLVISFSTGDTPQALTLYIIRSNGDLITLGPYNFPANQCRNIKTITLTNPPIYAVVGVLRKADAPPIWDVIIAPPAPPPSE